MERRGFTLIELLVVIAIIAILAAILFPVFARAREKARQASCMSNVKQISLGFQMYTSDYDDMYPASWYVANNQDGYVAVDTIYPYVKNYQLFQCPSRKTLNPLPLAGAIPSMNRNGLAYATNTNYWGGNNGAGIACNHPMGRDLSVITTPAETILIMDYYGAFEAAAQYSINANIINGSTEIFRHSETANFGFCDGHAKALNRGAACQQNANGVYRLFTIQED